MDSFKFEMCDNFDTQRLWLDILDETKRKKAALDSARKEAALAAAKDRKSATSMDTSNRMFCC